MTLVDNKIPVGVEPWCVVFVKQGMLEHVERIYMIPEKIIRFSTVAQSKNQDVATRMKTACLTTNCIVVHMYDK